MRERNFDAEIYRLVILGVLLAILGDIVELIIALKQYRNALKGKSDEVEIIEPF
jgi:hypothetical protein